MSTLMSVLIGMIIVCPFVVSLCLLMFNKWRGRTLSFQKNADYTTPFLFLSVYIIMYTLFGSGVGYLLLIIAITIGLGYAFYEKKRVKDFEIRRLLRKVWRLYFILLLVAYISLLIMGLVLSITQAVSG